VAFWTFVAICVVAGAASSVMRNRETQKTIRQAIEKGQTLDPATLERLLQTNAPPPSAAPQTRFGLITGGLVMVCVGVGLAVMGWFISLDKPEAFHPMLGVGSLVGLIGVALLVSSAFVAKSNGTDRG
jgi:hypothetical protein